MMMPNWTREPLVHFIGLGGLIYLALTWGGEGVDPASRIINVGEAEQAQIALGFERVMGRAPTDTELDLRIEQYVRDEVLYREALRLGLDQGDAVVRQRMVAKMDLSASAAAEAAEPDDSTLRSFFEENSERYQDTALLSFDQVFFSTEAGARAALASAVGSGEAISLPASLEGETAREVQVIFGEQFSRGLAALDTGADWQGPIASGFGWHAVRLRQRDLEPGDFSALRERVENDWRSVEIETRKRRAFEVLRSAYRIDIDR